MYAGVGISDKCAIIEKATRVSKYKKLEFAMGKKPPYCKYSTQPYLTVALYLRLYLLHLLQIWEITVAFYSNLKSS